MIGTHVALLRGINVGGNNKLPMKDLTRLFEQAGCRDVRTYIQSGNVIFTAAPALAKRIPAVMTAAIAAEFGLKIPLILRTPIELAETARHNPFLTRGNDQALYVAFLASSPTAAQVAGLDPNRSPPDELVVRGRDVYLFYPNGGARSKLTNAYFDSKLETVSTMRNWRTTLTLLELAGG